MTHSLARFDVALIQARSASECIFGFFVMHLLAPPACIENALYFELPRKIQRELIVLIKTAQHQSLRVELVFPPVFLVRFVPQKKH